VNLLLQGLKQGSSD